MPTHLLQLSVAQGLELMAADHAGTDASSNVTTLPVGLLPLHTTTVKTHSMGLYRCVPGVACTPRPRTTRPGARGPRPICRGTLVLVEVSRLPGHTRKPQVL